MVVQLLHFILLESMQWLSKENIQSIDRFLFSGALGGFVGRYVEKIIF